MTTNRSDALSAYRVNACLECGRCTAICPVARTHTFSPRRLLSKAISGGTAGLAADRSLWECLTCRLCEEVCPMDIPYSDLNRAVRSTARQIEEIESCTHGGIFEQITALMQRPQLAQDRLGWLTPDLKVSKTKGDTLFFTGCSPYFAAYFGEPYTEKLLGSLRAAVKLLNLMEIKPLLLANERCCGHDLLLRGEPDQFATLAAGVAEQIRATGVKRVVTTCPECLMTLRTDYPDVTGDLGVELLHISQLLESQLPGFEFAENETRVTYQDPCRLGRYAQLYDQPRTALQSVPGLELTEMAHSRERAICCGNTAWIGCNAGTKTLQLQRLAEAEATGSELLLTACPKCLIHLTCACGDQTEPDAGRAETGEQKAVQATGPEIRDTWEYLVTCLK